MIMKQGSSASKNVNTKNKQQQQFLNPNRRHLSCKRTATTAMSTTSSSHSDGPASVADPVFAHLEIYHRLYQAKFNKPSDPLILFYHYALIHNRFKNASDAKVTSPHSPTALSALSSPLFSPARAEDRLPARWLEHRQAVLRPPLRKARPQLPPRGLHNRRLPADLPQAPQRLGGRAAGRARLRLRRPQRLQDRGPPRVSAILL